MKTIDKPTGRADDAELYAAGVRAARRKGGCQSVLVAPDHTGENNYHTCGERRQPHPDRHFCGCGHRWDSLGNVTLGTK